MNDVATKPLLPIESLDKWDKLIDNAALNPLVGNPCFGGVYKSPANGQVRSFALAFPRGMISGRLVYRLVVSIWEKGHPRDNFARTVAEASLVYDLKGVCYDPWDMESFAREVGDYGVKTLQFSESAANYDRPCREFAECIERGTIGHGGNTVFREQLRQCQVIVTANGLMMPSNRASGCDITAVKAALLAIGAKDAHLASLVAQREQEREYVRAVELVSSRTQRR